MRINDWIEKQTALKAPPSRVWRALIDRTEFGTWFGVKLPAGRFTPGETVSGNITYPGYEHLVMEVVVESVEPERLLSYRWHPYAVDPDFDYSAEPMTLVELTLEERDGGAILRVVESGFGQIPASRRARAYEMNEGGWAEQMKNVERHVSKTS